MQTTEKKNVTLLLSLSSIFEYYDFIIYGLMSSYLGKIFFPQEEVLLGQIHAFILFSIGYFIRPFGGIILAMFGDTKSVKNIFVRSNFVLAIATIIISLMPSHSMIGSFAGICIIILRIAQAVTFSIELPGAMHFIQYSSKNKSSQNFSVILSGTALGAVLASFSLYLLESYFTHDEIIDYAWRIPFIFGSILCLISFSLRKLLPEIVQKPLTKGELLNKVLPEYKKILACVMIILFPAFLIIMNIFFPTFLKEFYHHTTKDIFLAAGFSLIFSALFSPLISFLTKNVDKISFIRFVIFISIIIGLVINFLFLRYSFANLVIGLCIYQALITSVMVHIFPLMSEIFASDTRFTLMTVCYNVAYAFAALGPALVLKLSNTLHSPFGMWAFLIILSIFILANINSITTVKNYKI